VQKLDDAGAKLKAVEDKLVAEQTAREKAEKKWAPGQVGSGGVFCLGIIHVFGLPDAGIIGMTAAES
jgi:protein-S-isoprenylcysteine O-methyltransferase Ste14